MPPDQDHNADLTDAEREMLDFDESNLTDADAIALNATETAVAAQAEANDGAAADPVPADGQPAAEPADAAPAVAPEAAPAAADPAPAAEPAAAPAPVADVAPATAPLLVIAPPENAAADLARIAADKAAAAEAFDDGEMTAKQYQAKIDALNEEKSVIDFAVNNANLSAQMAQAAAQADWDRNCEAFFKEPAAAVWKDPVKFEAMNANIRDLATMPRNRTLSWRQLLEKADILTRMELDMPARGAPTAPPPPAAAKPADKPLPTPKSFPPSLGALPVADTTDATGGQFAHLDRMATSDPIGYEEALAKMSDSQRDAYFKT